MKRINVLQSSVKRFAVILVGTLLIYTLCGFVLAPFIVRWYVPRYTLNSLQCRAILNSVRINPYLLTFEADGFNLSQADGSPIAAFERLFVDLEMKGLFHWAVILREVRVDKPALHVVFGPDGRINLEKLAPRSQEPKKADTKPFRMLLEHIVISGGQIDIADRRQSEPAELSLQEFDLKIENLSTLEDYRGTYLLTAGTTEGERVALEGDITLSPLSSRGNLTLSRIRTATPWKFVRDTVNLAPPNGQIDISTDYQLDAAGPVPEMALTGLRVGLSDLTLGLVDADKAFLDLKKLDLDVPRFDLGKKHIQMARLLLDRVATHIVNLESPEPPFYTDTLTVEGGECDLGNRSLTISRILVKNGNVDVSLDQEGRLNWTRLIALKEIIREGPGSGPATHSDSPPWKFLIKSFEIEGFRSRLPDLTKVSDKPMFDIKELNARVTEVDGISPSDFHLGFQVEQGGSIAVQGKVDPSKPSVEAEVHVTGFNLTPLQPYLDPYVFLTLQSGAVSTQGKFSYGLPDAGADIAYEGSFNLDRLSLSKQKSREAYLGWDAFMIPKLKLTLQPNGLEAEEIRLSRPFGEVIIAEDGTVNLAKLVRNQDGQKKGSGPPGPVPKKDDEAFAFRIGKVRLDRGKLIYADLSLRPQFKVRIHDLKGTVSHLSSKKDVQTRIQLDGQVDEYGLARISGVTSLYDPTRSTDIEMIFRNVEMTSLTPYSGKFAGRRIKSGKLSTDLKYKIQDSKLVGDNKIIVDNLLLGERVDSPNAVNLPLDLAIALLKDSNGLINIGLPVSGDLSNPQFRIGPVIWKAFVNLLKKAVTAPFRALGSLFGNEAQKFDAVEFDPGRDELLPPEKEKLKKLAEALQARPELKLVIKGRYSAEADGMEIRERSVCRTIATRLGQTPGPEEAPGPPDFTDSKTRQTLEEMFQERFGKATLDDLEKSITKGTIQPRTPERQQTEAGSGQKQGTLSKIINSVKLYKIIPGGKSPEQAAAITGELYVRLVEGEPVSEETLQELAGSRAYAVYEELKTNAGIPAHRLTIIEPEPLPGDAHPSAKLALDAL